ncbi:MAG: hypothetical protein HY289_11955 [Planctomycetes bacterium]|nr:hypothetical protein [Planctomycetota bacterium]
MAIAPSHVEPIAAPFDTLIIARRTEHGVTIDFPLAVDAWVDRRLRAWRTFEIGIFVMMGALIWFAYCAMLGWDRPIVLSAVGLIAGILLLMWAGSQSWSTWTDPQPDDDVRQLSVAGNLLIRTARDHRKQIWYRDEIRELAVDVAEGSPGVRYSEPQGSEYLTLGLPGHYPVLTVVLHNHDRAVLVSNHTRAELEWIAELLRHALAAEPDPAKTPLSEAIKADNESVGDERSFRT